MVPPGVTNTVDLLISQLLTVRNLRTIDIPVVLPGVTLVSIVLQKRLAVKNLQIKYSGVIYYEPVDPPGVTRDL